MGIHRADISWALADTDAEDADFLAGRYSRGHRIVFEGGRVVPGSASPQIVGRWAVEAAVDPEEMLVAALSSCHMLSFLHVARSAGYVVAAYDDRAEGVMEAIAPGRQAVTRAMLRPRIDWIGPAPGADVVERMHHEAHETCFIANSVKTEISVIAAAAPDA